MSEKLKALTDKIYSEGITKAKEESAKILAQAKEEASKILEEAKSEKIRIISEAENQAKTNKKKVEAEIKLASQKATNSIKQELRNILTEKIIEAPTKASLQNPDTLKEVIVACLSSLSKTSEGTWNINLPESQAEKVQKAINADKQSNLKSGIKINPSKEISNGFEVVPDGENYQLKFDDETFIQFFGSFLKLETKEIIGN